MAQYFWMKSTPCPSHYRQRFFEHYKKRKSSGSGTVKTRKINCRIISATNKLPSEAIRDGEMREDLFYRLSTGMILIPPLRERGDDLELLADYFIAKCNEEIDATVTSMSPELKRLLKSYYFPGNCRELANIIESAMNMTIEGENILDVHHLPTYMKKPFLKMKFQQCPMRSRSFSDKVLKVTEMFRKWISMAISIR